jgi:hypothetical protein
VADPLHTALTNTNYLYLHHTPALVSVCPIGSVANRTRAYVVPVIPSVDTMRYTVEHRILPGFNGTATVQVEWATVLAGPWTSIYGATATAAMTTGTWFLHSHTIALPASARLLRFTYSVWGGAGRVGHILVRPAPSSAAVPFVGPYGTTSSGFRVYDDSLLNGAAGQPVTTEMLDRCRRNTVKILRDRWQMAFSLVQDDGVTHAVAYTAPAGAGGGDLQLGHTAFCTPALAGTKGTLAIRVLATVSGGATADLILVSIGNATLTFAADGLVNSADCIIYGTLNEVRVRVANTGVNTTSLHACVAFWRPGN